MTTPNSTSNSDTIDLAAFEDTGEAVLSDDITINLGLDDQFRWDLRGKLTFIENGYGDGNNALILEGVDDEGPFQERLSTNLRANRLFTFEIGTVWIKNWSEHTGLADNLVATGLFEKVQESGPIAVDGSTATLLRVVALKDYGI